MDDIFLNGVFRAVKPTTNIYPTSNIDYDILYQEEKNRKIAKEQTLIATREREKREFIENDHRIKDNKTYRGIIENARLRAVNEVNDKIGDVLVAEVFASIYIRALPHDKYFIEEHQNIFKTIAKRYSDYIGGFNNLYKKVNENKSPFLRGVYNIINESKKKIVKERNIKSTTLMNEDDIREIIQPKPTDEEREELLKKIDELGADELAELVNNKIINVVKDEKQRQKSEMEMQTVIKSEVEDEGDEATSTVYGDSGETESTDDTSKSDEKSTDENKEDEDTKDEEAKESWKAYNRKKLLEKYDPINKNMVYDRDVLHFQNFFFHIMESCYKDKLRNSVEEWSKPQAQKLRKAANKSPINANNILNPKDDDTKEDIRTSAKSDPDVIGENHDMPYISLNDVYNEAITEYTLYETAYTMKLINITAHDVSEQIKWLMNN